MLESSIRSARQVGCFTDFHVWADRSVEGAIRHALPALDSSKLLFKFVLLNQEAGSLNYDYLVWIDADTWFVRNPGDFLRVMQGSPVHCTLESNACIENPVPLVLPPSGRAKVPLRPKNDGDLAAPPYLSAKTEAPLAPEWENIPLPIYVELMQAFGVRSKAIFSADPGMFIVHHDAVDTLLELTFEFREWAAKCGYSLSLAPLLAYGTHMLCGDPYAHTLRATSDLWASDWTGVHGQALPDGNPWMFTDRFNGERFEVNPAIVHLARSPVPSPLAAPAPLA